MGTIIGQFSASDPDLNSTLSFSLFDQNGTTHNNLFNLESNGTLRTAAALDYEANTTHLIRVRVSDQFNSNLDQLFTVSVLDQADGNLSNSTVFNISKTSNAQPNGYNYPVSVSVPAGGINPKPVAILLHGNGGAGSGMISQYSNLLNDHILIAPSGYGNSWNITEETSDLPDIDFLRDLILQLKGFPNVNTSHIRVLGSSNGAALANPGFCGNR